MLKAIADNANNFILACFLLTLVWLNDADTVEGMAEINSVGEATRHRSLTETDIQALARTLVGECARCGDEEVRWIAHVVVNRLKSGRYGDEILDVVTFRRGKAYAFSTWDPRENKSDVTGAHVDRSTAFGRMRNIAREVWFEDDPTGGATEFYHPASMRPALRVPKWARGRHGVAVGGAIFFR